MYIFIMNYFYSITYQAICIPSETYIDQNSLSHSADKDTDKHFVIVEAKDPPILIHPSQLLNLPKSDIKIINISVRLKTSEGLYSKIDEFESFEVNDSLLSTVEKSSQSWSLLFILPMIATIVLSLAVIYLYQRHQRTQTSFSRFVNSHYDARNGVRIGSNHEEEDHQEVPPSFSDNSPLVI